MVLCILWDSLRVDFAEKYMKGIFPQESWTKFQTIETFTAPVISSIITGKTPEELGIQRDESAFWTAIDPSKIDDTLFDHFESYISLGRLIGPGPREMPPSRKEHFEILPPIKWRAQSNWDPDIFQYIGAKYSITSPDYYDLIWYHPFITHGPFSIYTGEGPKECPEVVNCDRLMQRLAETDRPALLNWYKKGVDNAIATLMGIEHITNGMETIICFADHGECLGEEINGVKVTGHFGGMKNHPDIGMVPCWINRPDVKFPENMSHLKLKDFIVDCYNKYEKNNEEYQQWKKKKLSHS